MKGVELWSSLEIRTGSVQQRDLHGFKNEPCAVCPLLNVQVQDRENVDPTREEHTLAYCKENLTIIKHLRP